MKNSFNGQSVLVTGGTGAFGQKFLNYVRAHAPKRVTLFSRDEMKHAAVKRLPYLKECPWLHFRIGDVCRPEDLEMAMLNTDIVIHAAAMKHLPECEANPAASTLVNVEGTRNVINAFHRSSAKSLIFLSTDKAPYASSTYGAQKFLGEKLILEAAKNNPEKQIYSLRYSNVIDSTGAVFHIFANLFQQGKTATVNGSQTFRGFVTQQEVLTTIESSLHFAKGGEVFVLVPQVIRISELAQSMQGIMGKGEAVVKDTLGAGWEKESATLIMAEEATFAKDMPNGAAKTAMLDNLSRHTEAPALTLGENKMLTLEDCTTLTEKPLQEFLKIVMRENQIIQ